MKFLQRLWALLLFFIIASYTHLYSSNPANSVVGAIRWDAWGDHPSVGPQVEASMGPARYHYRLPFFGQETGFNSVEAQCITQACVDQEIVYAKNAGLDYWAFIYYTWKLGTARELYLSSSMKNDINFCMIATPDRLDSASNDVYVSYFQMSNYQKVLGNRPLFYLFRADAATQAGIDDLFAKAQAAGVPAPYLVFMNQSGASFTPTQTAAHTRYAFGGDYGKPWATHTADEVAQWNTFKSQGKQVIPHVTTGWDKRTRYENPVSWDTNPAYIDKWVQAASPNNIANHLQTALDWNYNNTSNAEANAVLIYAWNEFDEGGWICPTDYYGADRLNKIADVLGGTQQTTHTPPTWGTDLALGGTASASSTHSSNSASNVNDGNDGTAWSAGGKDNQWIEIDLGAPTEFNLVVLKSVTFNRILDTKIEYFDGTNWIEVGSEPWITPYSPSVFKHVAARYVRAFIDDEVSWPILHSFEVYDTAPIGRKGSLLSYGNGYYVSVRLTEPDKPLKAVAPNDGGGWTHIDVIYAGYGLIKLRANDGSYITVDSALDNLLVAGADVDDPGALFAWEDLSSGRVRLKNIAVDRWVSVRVNDPGAPLKANIASNPSSWTEFTWSDLGAAD